MAVRQRPDGRRREDESGSTPSPTFADFFAVGHRAAFDLWVSQGGGSAALHEVTAACARILMHWSVVTADGLQVVVTHRGTAFHIGDGRFLTAGHGIRDGEALRDRAGHDRIVLQYDLLLADGSRGAIEHIHWHCDGEGDFAVLQTRTSGHPRVRLGLQDGKAVAFAAGYPEGFGVNGYGRVERLEVDDRHELDPLVYACDLTQPLPGAWPTEARVPLVAGCAELTGVSGGPVFGLDGRVFAIQIGLAARTSDGAPVVCFERLSQPRLAEHLG